MSYVWHKQGQELLSEIQSFSLEQNCVGMWYIGQMGMIFRWNGITICVDPVLGAMPDDRGVDRRNYPVPFLPEDLQVDYVLCTHGHADHIHGETLRKLAQTNPQMEIYVPKPLTEVVAGYGIRTEQVKGIRQDEPADFREGFSVRGVATAHEEYQYDEEGASRTLGYVFRLGDHRLLHAGDTVVTQKLIGDLKEEHGLDAAMVPINGRDLERHARGIVGNMDSREACWFGSMIGADLLIPLHYDMIGGNEENPLVFAEYMERMYPERRYHIMRLGEKIVIV